MLGKVVYSFERAAAEIGRSMRQLKRLEKTKKIPPFPRDPSGKRYADDVFLKKIKSMIPKWHDKKTGIILK
ncbi:MAG TPA: hypothetical protein V6D12_14080 [Candidatus Obscuribacterales bacterium]